MKSPAAAHRDRVLAQQAAEDAANSTGTMEGATIYELQLAQLAAHKRALKNLQSLERRIELKKEFLPEYNDYIEGVLAEKPGVQDEVLVTVMLWELDAGQYENALPIAVYAIENGLSMPEGHKRTIATAVTEEIADHALKTDATTMIDILEDVLELIASADMPDEVRAKLHKALGLAKQDNDDMLTDAIAHLERAYELNTNSGVIKFLNTLKKKSEKLNEQKESDR